MAEEKSQERTVSRRCHLEDERQGRIWKVVLGDPSGTPLAARSMPKGPVYLKAFIQTGEFEDGRLGEVFITVDREGSFVRGLLDGFATLLSIALQYGIPLEVIVEKFQHSRFQPSGFTNDRSVPMAKSFLDYMVRKLALRYLPPEMLDQLGIEDRNSDTADTGEIDHGRTEEDGDTDWGLRRPAAGLSGAPFNESKSAKTAQSTVKSSGDAQAPKADR